MQDELELFSICGARLASERARIGLLSGKMAAACDVTAEVQGHYEKGRRLPSGRYLVHAEGLGVDILYVLTGRRAPSLAGEDGAQLQRIINLWPGLPSPARAALATLLEALTTPGERT